MIDKRNEILNLAREWHASNIERKEFFKGETYIPASGKVLDGDDLANLMDASLNMWLTAGKYADLFESEFPKFLGAKYCLLVNSGSSANLIAMSALLSHKLEDRKLRSGDEIITVAAGFPTTVSPIIQNGLVPVFVDIEKETYNVDVSKLENALSEKTRGIVLAHTLGNPFNIAEVKRLASKHNLWLIEDNCDALGSIYDSKYTGTFGHISTYSFYPAHHITMGEGGAVVTDDPLLYIIMKSLRDWGRDCVCPPGYDNLCGNRFSQKHGELPEGYDHKYVYSHFGYNLKATDMQAAIGVSQLGKLPYFIARRQENHRYLFTGLNDLQDFLDLPKAAESSVPSWFGFIIGLKESKRYNRNKVIEFLEQRKIGTRLLFAGNITKQPLFIGENIKYIVSGELNNTDFAMNNAFWIGVWPGIENIQLDYIIDKFHEFFRSL